MQISDYSQVLIIGSGFERPEFHEIRTGSSAEVSLEIFPGEIFKGSIHRLDFNLKSESRTFEVAALVANSDLRIRANLQATLMIGIGESAEVLSVPTRSVLGEMGNYFVFVNTEGSFERRLVTLGIQAGDRVEILEGVLPGDLVVTQGNYQLQYATNSPDLEHHRDHHEENSEPPTSKIWWIAGIGLIIALAIGLGIFIKHRQNNPF